MILDKLKFLYLSHCHYLTRTPDFSGLYSLEELLLNDCKRLVKVDESIRCLNKLVVLDMKNCTKLRKLPSGILMLKSLECLDLFGCSNLGNLAVFKGPLYKLWCSFFSSWTLPPKGVDSIGFSLFPVQASSCLAKLYLKDCHLSYLSEEIGNLISLRTLDLNQNNLSTLPDSICNLTRLKELFVENNKLSHLPSEIGDLDSLETLVLEHNNGFRALPESICKLVLLRELNLNDCNLSHLPSEIDRLISLESLYLGRNRSLTLPDSICHLTRLKNLGLGGCNLSYLPIGIGGLVSLATLNISENNICTIPDSISNLLWLETICLNNCAKLRSLPKLPRCTYVDAERCPSLESLPLELDQLGLSVHYPECNKFAENKFLTSLLKQLPKSKGLSEVQHFVSIVVPTAGDEEVHIWFPYHHGRGPNVSFVVPPSPSVKQKMLGWILRVLYWGPPLREAHDEVPRLFIEEVIFNKIKREELFYSFTPNDVDHVLLLYIPQGCGGFLLEGGDEVEIPIYACGNALVTINWAIDLIYEADEIHKGYDTLYQVVSI